MVQWVEDLALSLEQVGWLLWVGPKINETTLRLKYHKKTLTGFLGGSHLQHMQVPRLGVELEVQVLAYAIATATRDPSRIWDPYHSSWQCQILNPLSKARE